MIFFIFILFHLWNEIMHNFSLLFILPDSSPSLYLSLLSLPSLLNCTSLFDSSFFSFSPLALYHLASSSVSAIFVLSLHLSDWSEFLSSHYFLTNIMSLHAPAFSPYLTEHLKLWLKPNHLHHPFSCTEALKWQNYVDWCHKYTTNLRCDSVTPGRHRHMLAFYSFL